MSNIVPIHAFKDNYIWLILDKNFSSAIAVDPGEAVPLNAYLHKHHLKLSSILITHHHLDHSGGVADLLKEWGDIPVYGSINSKVLELTHRLKTHDEIHWDELTLKVLEIPGHTLDHIAFYNNEIIFSGDTLFSAGCGRVFEGTYEQMYHSLTELLKLSNEAKLYCGHEYTLQNLRFAELVEPDNLFIQEKINSIQQLLNEGKPTLPSILQDEKKMNPFLRCNEQSVIQRAEDYVKKRLPTPADVFKTLREWKNK